MKQLVELQKHAEDFKTLNTEVVVVFREESEGVEGLKKIKGKTKSTFTLAVDKDKKSTAAYSSKKMTFDNFVVAKSGEIKALLDGTLRTRATANELLKVLKEIEGK